MIYVFDLDGTLCTHVEDGDYRKAKPIKERIKKVNKLSKEGHNIVLYTEIGRASCRERV